MMPAIKMALSSRGNHRANGTPHLVQDTREMFSALSSRFSLGEFHVEDLVCGNDSHIEHVGFRSPHRDGKTGLHTPVRTGPIAVTPPTSESNLYEMLPLTRFGKIKTFAVPAISEKGYSLAKFSEMAVSACISPSILSSGAISRTSRMALRMRRTSSWLRCVPKFGKGQHRNAWFIPERSCNIGCIDGNLCQIFSRGIDVDCTIAKEESASLRDHDISTGNQFDVGVQSENFYRRTNGIGVRNGNPTKEAMGTTQFHHHRTNNGFIEHRTSGTLLGHPLSLTECPIGVHHLRIF